MTIPSAETFRLGFQRFFRLPGGGEFNDFPGIPTTFRGFHRLFRLPGAGIPKTVPPAWGVITGWAALCNELPWLGSPGCAGPGGGWTCLAWRILAGGNYVGWAALGN